MVKMAVQQGRSERSGESYIFFTHPPIDCQNRRFPWPFVDPLSDARTKFGEGRVSARRGWVGEKKAIFTILLWTDANPILDHIEGFFGHDVFGDQFALDLVRAIADDPIRHVL